MITLREQKERRKTIGASEVHKIFNFDTQQAQDLWELKLGFIDFEELENDSIDAGNILEEQCLDYYSKVNKVDLIKNERITNKKVNGLVVSLDAREEETSIPVENKVVKESAFEKWKVSRGGNSEYLGQLISVPRSYYIQVQAQIDTLDAEYGNLNINTLTEEEVIDPLNVVITDLHNKQLKIARDNELIEEMLKRCEYMLWCMRYKKRPSENEYLERYVF